MNQRKEYYALYDIDATCDLKKLCLVEGLIKEVSNDTWLIPGCQTKCYTENEAADVLCDAVPEVDCPACWSIMEFLPMLFNQGCDERMGKRGHNRLWNELNDHVTSTKHSFYIFNNNVACFIFG